MSRIRKAYEAKCRALLRHVRARRLEEGVQWLVGCSQRMSEREGIPFTQALASIHELLRQKVERWKDRTEKPQALDSDSAAASAPRRFLCDSGLGGLARWLRAAGCEAVWKPAWDDDELLQEGRRTSATILTTDSLLMERRVLRDGILPALWVPPTLTKLEQLNLVFRELRLSVREPRCMQCGGELRAADKESLRDRIPPKTYRWRDEYFLCARCDKLFWHGTHWQRISQSLSQAAGPNPNRT
ncbi:MAG: Mut7-C RNAse domain-containing protein [Verrucomicrobiota bacterium]